MKAKTLKRLWNVAKYVGLLTVSFWILETVFFLVLEGWHWTATNKYEERCDSIVLLGGFGCFALTLFVITEITSLILNEIED